MINIKENEDLSKLNHSCAHLLAQAVKHLYPNAKFWVGPVIEEGFYYDIDLGDEVIKEEDLPKIEKEMKKLSKDGKRIVRHEISKDEALEMFHDDPYKIDLIILRKTLVGYSDNGIRIIDRIVTSHTTTDNTYYRECKKICKREKEKIKRKQIKNSKKNWRNRK